jgi:hypothetical protein
VAVRGKGGLLVRMDPGATRAALSESGAQEMVMRGKAMPGWIVVDESACAKAADLRRWVKRGITFARGLPPK